MIKHIVMWKLKEIAAGGTKIENAKKMKLQLESLKDKIKQIKFIEVGINFINSDEAYDVVLYSEFETEENLSIYQNHQEHLKVANFVKSIIDKRAVVDYKV